MPAGPSIGDHQLHRAEALSRLVSEMDAKDVAIGLEMVVKIDKILLVAPL